jgi:cytochrome c553
MLALRCALRGRSKIEMSGIGTFILSITLPTSSQGWNTTLRNAWLCLRWFVPATAFAVQGVTAVGQLSTGDHLAEPGFWPTQSQPSREDFAGTDACSRCHASKTTTQIETPMARNLVPAAAAEILHSHRSLTFSIGGFDYQIDTGTNQAEYSVTNGNQRISYPLGWAFGTGRVAQSYLFRKEDGSFYEARISYFSSLKALNFTPWRAVSSPSGVQEAMYRPVGEAELERCFSCHSTASSAGGRFDEKHLIPGVTCEACHGPGLNHIKAMDAGIGSRPKTSNLEIFNPDGLLPSDSVDFCGACHGTFWDTKLSGTKGVSTTRSAPYRLVTSKCWGNGDPRLTCTACHDPHKQLETDAKAYDAVCRSCHVTSPGEKTTIRHPGAACPKATSNCTSCHMTKTFIPEMHANFTDHRIRVVKPGEVFPE